MFKIFKKHSKTLWISMQDVLAIIKSDYDKSWPFEIIEFRYGGHNTPHGRLCRRVRRKIL